MEIVGFPRATGGKLDGFPRRLHRSEMESEGERIAVAVRFPETPNKMLILVHTNHIEVTRLGQNSADYCCRV